MPGAHRVPSFGTVRRVGRQARSGRLIWLFGDEALSVLQNGPPSGRPPLVGSRSLALALHTCA